ncbi:MAG: amidohydrolase family protein, partial [Bacillota bacterium]|nr:amidohydrolase family protein [Bacillota bacterium]
DGTLYKVLCESKKVGVTVFVHAENGELIDRFQRDCVNKGQIEPKYHAVSRPTFVEGEGTHRAIYLAGKAGAPLYVAHVTCQDAVDEIVKARTQNQRVMGETCTHYLTTTKDVLSNEDFLEASKYVCSPALRDQCELDNLWKALNDGVLNAIVSDHCGIGLDLKKQGLQNFMLIPNGAPGAADRIHMIWSTGVATGKISKQLFVQTIATNPAKINGLYPKKGDIVIGADADIVIYDPEYRGVIKLEDNPNGIDFNVYEGKPMIGRVETVLLRGNVVVKDAKFVGKQGQGKFIPAKCYAAAYTGLNEM